MIRRTLIRVFRILARGLMYPVLGLTYCAAWLAYAAESLDGHHDSDEHADLSSRWW